MFSKSLTISRRISYLYIIISILLYTSIYAVAVSKANIHLYFLLVSKIFILVLPSFVLIQIVYSGKEAIDKLLRKQTAKLFINKTLFISFISSIVILGLSVGLLFYDQYAIQHHLWDIFTISNYHPSIIELVLIYAISILSFITGYSSTLWYVGKYLTIIGLDEKSQQLKLKNKHFVALLILVSTVIIFFVVDMLLVEYLSGGDFDGNIRLQSLIQRSEFYLLSFELAILIILSVLFFVIGSAQLKSRQIVLLSSTDTALNNIKNEKLTKTIGSTEE